MVDTKEKLSTECSSGYAIFACSKRDSSRAKYKNLEARSHTEIIFYFYVYNSEERRLNLSDRVLKVKTGNI